MMQKRFFQVVKDLRIGLSYQYSSAKLSQQMEILVYFDETTRSYIQMTSKNDHVALMMSISKNLE